MLKRVLFFLLSMSCFFASFITLLIVSFFVHSKNINHFAILLFLVPMFFLLPVFWKYLPKSLSSYLRVLLFSIISLSCITLLQFITNWYENSIGLKKYSFQVGNGLGPYRVLIQNSLMQKILNTGVSLFPYSSQYLIYITEDSLRVMAIKNDLSKSESIQRICMENDRYKCFKEIFLETNKTTPFNNTGCILMVAVGAQIIYEEKRKDNIKSTIEASIRIMELAYLSSVAIYNDSRVENIISGFPINKIKIMPQELIAEIDETPINKIGIRELILGFSSSTKLPYEESVIEAYLLRKVEDEIIQKFNDSMGRKVKEIKKNTFKRMNSDEAKELSATEITEYKKSVESFDAF